MATIYEELNSYREVIEKELNDYLVSKGLPPFSTYSCSPYEVDETDLSVAIYLANASMGMADYDGTHTSFDWFFMYRFNEEDTKEGNEQNVRLFSQVFEYLKDQNFGEQSVIARSGIFRMDTGEPINGGVYQLSTRINTSMDYGW